VSAVKTAASELEIDEGIARPLCNDDRESHQRDLFHSIEAGDHPKWTMFVQIMTEDQAAQATFNPFDLTKVWPKADYPLLQVGEFELNRNPENFFQDVEQAAFAPSNIVPGIGFSPDKMLQGRLFSYGDTQRYRLGVNHAQIPVNAPRCPVHAYHRDGTMRVDGNGGRSVHYAPNSKGALRDQPDFAEPPLRIDGAAAHWDHRDDPDYFSQPGNLFRLMTPAQRQTLFDNTARAIHGASEPVIARHVANCTQADPAYGAGVAEAVARLHIAKDVPDGVTDQAA
jgi:catalase